MCIDGLCCRWSLTLPTENGVILLGLLFLCPYCVLPQVLTLGAAHALSRAQRRELEATRDAEEEGWGWSARMQQPLMKTSCAVAALLHCTRPSN